MEASMADPQTRLIHHSGKWHIIARKGVDATAGAAWVSLGGCTCQLTAVRVWLACQGQGKR
jgi:hypothetical protein